MIPAAHQSRQPIRSSRYLQVLMLLALFPVKAVKRLLLLLSDRSRGQRIHRSLIRLLGAQTGYAEGYARCAAAYPKSTDVFDDLIQRFRAGGAEGIRTSDLRSGGAGDGAARIVPSATFSALAIFRLLVALSRLPV